jgi:site-specific recombinase XerD
MQTLVKYSDPNKPVITNVNDAFANFLRIDVANGDASPDTIRGYKAQVAAWVTWCRECEINPASATVSDVKDYRQDLVQNDYKPGTIAQKLTVIRRFYEAAVTAGLRADNPATGIKPPRERGALEDFGYFSLMELVRILEAVPKTGKADDLRDIAVLALMGLQGLRVVEVWRANVEDLQDRGEYMALVCRGKYHDRLIYLRPDVALAVKKYLAARGEAQPDSEGTPLFTATGNATGGMRLGRRGIRKFIADLYIEKAGVKRPGLSCHALRHTFATLAYAETHDLRALQDALGHRNPQTTSRYARVIDMARSNPALSIPIVL